MLDQLSWMLIGTGFTGALTLVFALRHLSRRLGWVPMLDVRFSPKGGCADAVVRELKKARHEILMQAYSFTCPQIAEGLGVTARHMAGVAFIVLVLILSFGILALRRLTPAGTLVARPVLPAAVLLRGLLTFMFFGFDVFVALVLVTWRGRSLTESGITLTATTVLWTAGSWVQARNTHRWPTYRFVQAGFATAGVVGGASLQ